MKTKLQKIDKRGFKPYTEEPKELEKQIALIKEIFPGSKVIARKELK